MTAPSSDRTAPGVIGPSHRLGVWVVGVLLGLIAFVLPAVGAATTLGWHVVLGVAGIAALGASPWARGLLVVGAVCAVASAALALVDTDELLVPVAVAGVALLGACETLALAGMWSSVGVLDIRAEAAHVRAIVMRCGLGLAAALACSIAGVVELPSPGVIAVIGVLAAGAVIVGSSLRTTGTAPPPPDPPRPQPHVRP